MKTINIQLTKKQKKLLEPIFNAAKLYRHIPFEDRPYTASTILFLQGGAVEIAAGLMKNKKAKKAKKYFRPENFLELPE